MPGIVARPRRDLLRNLHRRSVTDFTAERLLRRPTCARV
jgi:hypothetical protein